MLKLTKQERLVLIFVGSALLIGVGLNFCKKSLPSLDVQKIIKEQQKSSSPLNLNNANFQDLARISPIGPILAEEILLFRFRNGNFKSIEELKLIKGISQNKLNQIRDFLVLE